MQCPHCGFENLPGIVICTRCRAQLVAARPSSAAEFLPPRAGRWKWLRPLHYFLNVWGDRLPAFLPPAISSFFVSAWGISREAVAALLFSAVPGLGHLLRGQRLQAMGVIAVWCALIWLAVIWFGHWFGGLCRGLLIGLHAGAAMHAAGVRRIPVLRQRLACGAMLLLLCGGAYVLLYLWLSRDYEVIAAPFACEDLDVMPGDLLLMRRIANFSGCQRGDLVMQRERHLSMRTGAFGNVYLVLPERTLLRLIAFGGEEVMIADGKVSISGINDAEAAHLARGIPLPRTPLRLTLGEREAMAVAPLNTAALRYAPDQDLLREVWAQVFPFPESSLYAKGVAVYHPLWRRHWFAAAPARQQAVPQGAKK